jgi:hypothetical protein
MYPDEQKARIYGELMFKFQRVQERIKDIETENTVIDHNTPRELQNLKNQLRLLQEQIRNLY